MTILKCTLEKEKTNSMQSESFTKNEVPKLWDIINDLDKRVDLIAIFNLMNFMISVNNFDYII